jgi:hypothetical protein
MDYWSSVMDVMFENFYSLQPIFAKGNMSWREYLKCMNRQKNFGAVWIMPLPASPILARQFFGDRFFRQQLANARAYE